MIILIRFNICSHSIYIFYNELKRACLSKHLSYSLFKLAEKLSYPKGDLHALVYIIKSQGFYVDSGFLFIFHTLFTILILEAENEEFLEYM